MRYTLTFAAISSASMIPVFAYVGQRYIDADIGLHPILAGIAMCVMFATSLASINLIAKR